MTDQKLLDYLLPRLGIWKERLGLQHWETKLETLRRDEMDGNQGQCTYNGAVLFARIQILSPLDWREFQNKYESESTMVHELIHLLIWQMCPEKDTPEFTVLEQAITRLERALMQAYVKKHMTIKMEVI